MSTEVSRTSCSFPSQVVRIPQMELQDTTPNLTHVINQRLFYSMCVHVHMLRGVHTCQLHAGGGQDSFQDSVLIFHVEIRSFFLFLPVCSRLCRLLTRMTFQWRSSHCCKCRSQDIASYIQNTREEWEKLI